MLFVRGQIVKVFKTSNHCKVKEKPLGVSRDTRNIAKGNEQSLVLIMLAKPWNYTGGYINR